MTDAHPDSGHAAHEHPPVDHDHGDAHDAGSGHDQGPAQDQDHDPDHDPDHEHPDGLKGFVLSLFRPHSHDTADSVDSALESSTEGIRAVKISLVALGVTAVAQLIAVLITGSVALLADTIHNFSDALTAIPLWIAFVLSRRAANRRYTYGYGRAEDLAGVFIVAMIALSAILAAYESIRRLIDPQPLTHAWVVLGAGLIGFAGNELVAEYRIRVGTRIGSSALVADGLHARTDGFTSLAVVFGAIGFMSGFPLADPIVGLLITVAILAVLRGAARDIYRRLMDAVDPELVDAAEAAVRDVPGVRSVDSVQLRWIGHRMRAEITLTVDDTLSVVKAHTIADEAQHQLIHRVPRLDDATVHVNPITRPGIDHHAATGHHRAQPSADR
ncbi:MAG: cation transporter [Dermatophilaceae bacterium]|nr:cation transporter [Dermatophilaceae bacterium]